MKILHIITGLNVGGAETMLARLIEYSPNPSSHTVVSLIEKGEISKKIEATGAKVIALNLNPAFPVSKNIFTLYSLIRSEKFDVIQCWMYHANLLGGIIGRLAGCKRIFWGIHHTYLNGSKLRSKFVNWFSARLSSICCTNIICCSNLTKHVCEECGYEKTRLVVIPNGYDSEKLYYDEVGRRLLRKEFGIANGTLVIGHIGRFQKIKNHFGLIRAFAIFKKKFPDSKLLMAGKGVKESEELAELIKQLGLQNDVKAVGSRNDIKNFISAVDFTVLSSFGEAFPNVLAESMLCERIAISTDVGDAAYIVGNKDLIAKNNDDANLAEIMMKFASLPENIRIEMAQNAKKRILDNFEIKVIVKRYFDAWNS